MEDENSPRIHIEDGLFSFSRPSSWLEAQEEVNMLKPQMPVINGYTIWLFNIALENKPFIVYR